MNIEIDSFIDSEHIKMGQSSSTQKEVEEEAAERHPPQRMGTSFTTKSSSLSVVDENEQDSKQTKPPSVRTESVRNVEKIFGDERDLIVSRLITEGGSKPLVIENLKARRRRYSHDPLSVHADELTEEAPFVSTPLDRFQKKVSIIGCGQVGLAVAYSILNKELCNSLVLVDVNGVKLDGEVVSYICI